MGNDHEADDVYLRRRVVGRWRLRQHKQGWPRAVIDSLYWLVARYGVPYQRPALFIACVLLSIAVFSSSAVVRKNSPAGTSLRPETIDAQEAVGVSLNQILPVPGRCPGGTSGRPATNQ